MKKRNAFTLAEMLLVFVIIGIIGSIGVVTVKPWEKAYKYSYIKIYNGLSTAIYNHMVTTDDTNAFPDNARSFCNALLEYLNTSNNAQNVAANNACTRTAGADAYLGNAPTSADFRTGGKNPKILLSNGARLWIGANGLNPYTYTQTIDATAGITDEIKYYLVYVDLNGDRGPNAINYNENGRDRRLPDIVSFAVTDKFSVIPLGYPKYDQRYLSAHIMYPVSEDDDAVTAEGERASDAMTYYEAVVGAYSKNFGTHQRKIVTMGIPYTYDLENSLPAANRFKLVINSEAMENSYYKTHPVFDRVLCGDGKTAQQIVSDKSDSHCDVKIFNYN